MCTYPHLRQEEVLKSVRLPCKNVVIMTDAVLIRAAVTFSDCDCRLRKEGKVETRGRHRRCELCFILLTTLECFHPKEPLHTHLLLVFFIHTVHPFTFYNRFNLGMMIFVICFFPSQRSFRSLPLESLLLFSHLFIFFSPWQLGKKNFTEDVI